VAQIWDAGAPSKWSFGDAYTFSSTNSWDRRRQSLVGKVSTALDAAWSVHQAFLLSSSIPVTLIIVKLEYFERVGEGSIIRDAYLAGATKKE